MSGEIILDPEDNIEFAEKTYKVKDITTKDFNNMIWRSGFWYGLMCGATLILILVAGILSPYI